MKRTIQVRISRGDRQFVAECLDLPVVTQAATLDELASNIREAIGLHLDGEDLADLGFSSNPTILATGRFVVRGKSRPAFRNGVN
jgi:predicted RNase H-like HicB family nuclease